MTPFEEALNIANGLKEDIDLCYENSNAYPSLIQSLD